MVIFILTFQSKHTTTVLADRAVVFLQHLGIEVERKPLRHYIHYFEYFVLGLLIAILCNAFDGKMLIGFFVGCGIALIEEGLKIWLPTREFDICDLVRDYCGLGFAMFVFWFIKTIISNGR